MKGHTMTATLLIAATLAFCGGYVVHAALARGEQVEKCRDCDVVARAVEAMMDDDEAVGRLCEEIADDAIRTTHDASPVTIDVRAIAQIESSGDARAVGKFGERGLCQIRRATWNEWVECMGQHWSFDDAFDPGINRAVAHYGLNTRIPQMLGVYGISDTVAHRLAAYNWGIGNLRYAVVHERPLPEDVQRYVRRYRRAVVELQRRSPQRRCE